jgi:hypothetical protein
MLENTNEPIEGFNTAYKELRLKDLDVLGVENTERQAIPILVNHANDVVTIDASINSENKSVLGLYVFSRNGAVNDYASKLTLSIANKQILTDLNVAIIEKNPYLSEAGCAFGCVFKNLNKESVRGYFKDGGIIPTPYTAYLYLICERR